MIKCASVYTNEVDNPESALTEVLSQLREKLTLLTCSIGIVMCHTEFIASGVLRHICENLPFETAGVTTASQAVNDGAGDIMLTIFIITSDDVQFKAGVTESLEAEIDMPMQTAFDITVDGMLDKPALVLSFPPLLKKNSGDAYLDVWGRITPNTPVFGTICADDTLELEECETICNGRHSKNAMSFVLCCGNIHPRFLVGTLPQDKALPYKGEVTKSSGAFVSEINNTNAFEYFKSIGLISNGLLLGGYFLMPFFVDQKKREDYDGIPIVRAHVLFLDDGTAVFLGDISEGSIISIIKTDADDVLASTQQAVSEINKVSGINGVLLFPCIARRIITMHVDPMIELNTIAKTIHPHIPFMAGYSGGETCPTSIKGGVPINRFHNHSIIAMIL